ncbi:DNA-processing protein DprA [Thalassospira profundimaris]|nr:DNA-processing protein DprA [Thalassospira profundimaris]
MRLARSGQIGPVTFRRLLEQFGAARMALEALPDIIAKSRAKRPMQIATRDDTIAEIEMALAISARPIIWGDPEYPTALAAIEDAPPYFYVLGDPAFLNQSTIGIVGARNASLGGCQFAGKLGRELALAGYNVASGLARGIDGAAHEGAINALRKQTGNSSSGSSNAGVTIAVVAGGVDVIYPREHADLYRRICENGCVISEMAPGLKPQARHFPRRNRIISGLSQGIVVIEAGRNSGSLITARMAAEQGRDVFAVPGSPTDPRAAGPNSLIRDGAILCDSIDAILDVVGPAQGLRQFNAPVSAFNSDNRPAPAQSGVIDIAAILAGMEQDRATMPDDEETPKTEKTAQSPAKATAPKPQPSQSEQGFDTEKIYELLSSAPMAIDSLIRASNLSAGAVSTLLIELELAGRVERHPGNRVSRIPN